jgi:N-acetylneuraminic acid mutarotase
MLSVPRASQFVGLVLAGLVAGGLLLGAGVGGPGDASPPDRAAAWTRVETENAPTARHENAFVEVGGRFYLLGGRGDRPVDIYDPETQRWTQGPAPPFQMHHFQAVAYDGDIYVVGAWADDYPRENGLSHVYVYDTDANEWRKDAPIPPGRRRGSAGAVVHDDKIYLVGGNVGGHGPHATAVAWFDVFDPATGTWTALRDRPAPHARDHFQAAVVNEKLVVVGGRDSGVEGFIDSTLAAVDVYDFETQEWSTWSDAPLPTERAGCTVAVHGDEVIITGGEGFGQTWGQTEALNVETREWRSLGRLNQPRHGTQMFAYRDQLYIAAGSGDQGGGPELTSMETYAFE